MALDFKRYMLVVLATGIFAYGLNYSHHTEKASELKTELRESRENLRRLNAQREKEAVQGIQDFEYFKREWKAGGGYVDVEDALKVVDALKNLEKMRQESSELEKAVEELSSQIKLHERRAWTVF